MLEFAKAQNETVAIVADAVDRFQRSFKESVLIDELIRKEKIELHFYREAMVIGKGASSTDILRWDFSVMGAKSYVLNLSENVRRSLEYKRRNGEWGARLHSAMGTSGMRTTRERAHSRSRARLDAVRGLCQGLFLHQRRSRPEGAGMGPAQQDPQRWPTLGQPDSAYSNEPILLRSDAGQGQALPAHLSDCD